MLQHPIFSQCVEGDERNPRLGRKEMETAKDKALARQRVQIQLN